MGHRERKLESIDRRWVAQSEKRVTKFGRCLSSGRDLTEVVGNDGAF